MSAKVRAIQGKGDWSAIPPTGMNDGDVYGVGNDFLAQGGVVNRDAGEAFVEESDTPGMSVKVALGIIYVENSSWNFGSWEPRFFQVARDAETTGITISSNPSGQTRFDIVCQEVDKITVPNDDADNVCPITVVEGTPGAGIPNVPGDMEPLAVVEVADGETIITNDLITDVRRQVYARPQSTNGNIQELVDGSTVTFDLEWGKYDKFFVEIAGNRTFAFDNVPYGLPFLIYVQQGSGGSHTPTFPSSITDDGDALEFATAAGAIDAFVVVLLPTNDYSIVKVATNQS